MAKVATQVFWVVWELHAHILLVATTPYHNHKVHTTHTIYTDLGKLSGWVLLMCAKSSQTRPSELQSHLDALSWFSQSQKELLESVNPFRGSPQYQRFYKKTLIRF